MHARLFLVILFTGVLSARLPAAWADGKKADADVFLDVGSDGASDDFSDPVPMQDSAAAKMEAPVADAAPKPTGRAAKKAAAAESRSAPEPAISEGPPTIKSDASAESDAPPATGKSSAKSTAKAGAGKGSFKVTTASCKMHAKSSEASGVLIEVPAEKKIWVEEAGKGWFKAFRKHGAGYLAANCFEAVYATSRARIQLTWPSMGKLVWWIKSWWNEQRVVRFSGLFPPPRLTGCTWCTSMKRSEPQRLPDSPTCAHRPPSRSWTAWRWAAVSGTRAE